MVLGVPQVTTVSSQGSSKSWRIQATSGVVRIVFNGNGWSGVAWAFFKNNASDPLLIKGYDYDSRGDITGESGTSVKITINAWSSAIITTEGDVSGLQITEVSGS